MAGGDGRQVRDGIPAGESSPGSAWPLACCAVRSSVQNNLLEVGTLEIVKRFWIKWQALSWGCSKHDQTPPCLGNSIVPCLQDIEAHLIAHPDQGGKDEFEHHPTLVRHQVPHILQDVEARPVEVAVAQVG